MKTTGNFYEWFSQLISCSLTVKDGCCELLINTRLEFGGKKKHKSRTGYRYPCHSNFTDSRDKFTVRNSRKISNIVTNFSSSRPVFNMRH